mgnify:CR=1 FL=1
MVSYGYYDMQDSTRTAYFQLSFAHKVVKSIEDSRQSIGLSPIIKNYVLNAIKRAQQVIIPEGVLTPDEVTDFRTKLEDMLKRFPEAEIFSSKTN